MNKPKLISQPDQVSAAWLRDVLTYSGIDAQLESFSQESIGTGQVGENVRFTLSGSESTPNSIVGKFMSSDPISKQTGIQQETYIKEVFFYKTLQEKVDIQTPHIYFADIDDDSHEFVLIMEDLAPGVQGDQLSACSIDDAALALEELAKLHGPCYGKKSLADFSLLKKADDAEKIAQFQLIYRMVLPGFLERYSDQLSAEHIKVIEKLPDLLPAYQNIYAGPFTLIHNDYRLDNMMFGGPHALTVVDWQTIALGCGLNDASYFLGTSLLSEDRIEHESALLKHYQEVLNSYKINLNWNDCWQYYRSYAPSGLIMAVIASMIVAETERGNAMFVAMASRSCQQTLELESFKLLGS